MPTALRAITSPAIISPMGSAEVAAGEGALQTCSMRAVFGKGSIVSVAIR
jgi:hypothetical protein